MARIKPLPDKLQNIARNELGEDPESMGKHLQNLRSWIEQQQHLNARLDEQFLIQFLRGCKYDVEKAKKKIDLFFTLKTKFPELTNLTNVNDPVFRKIYNYGFGISLPRPFNDHGERIFYMKYKGDVAKGLVDVDDLYRITNAMHEIILMDDPYACINGIIYILDVKEVTLGLASQFTPTFVQKLVQFYEKSLPLRIKGVHIINMSGFLNGVLSMALPLLSEKLRQRLSVNGQNYESLYQILPKEYFPKDLGGENGSVAQLLKDFEQKWQDYADYFKENVNYGTNESLRPGKPIDFDSIYGTGGSFRKLDVD